MSYYSAVKKIFIDGRLVKKSLLEKIYAENWYDESIKVGASSAEGLDLLVINHWDHPSHIIWVKAGQNKPILDLKIDEPLAQVRLKNHFYEIDNINQIRSFERELDELT